MNEDSKTKGKRPIPEHSTSIGRVTPESMS